MDEEKRRRILESLFQTAITAVDPERLTADALVDVDGPVTLIAIGKAATGMCRGAARAIHQVDGVSITNQADEVPDGVELLVGDHPVPGEASFAAGRRAMEVAAEAGHPIIALVSGGGSSLCEHPIDGIEPLFIQEVNRALLASGASIEEVNLVRRHLSAVKNGGLAACAPTPVRTLVLSDVCGRDPAVVASGPTIHLPRDPDAVWAALTKHGIRVPRSVREAITRYPDDDVDAGPVTLLADGHTATGAMVTSAEAIGLDATHYEEWLTGRLEETLRSFFDGSVPGITVGAGEPEVTVTGNGSGGRSTHAALLAATIIHGTDQMFGAFATDGVDGNTRYAGAIVDGRTLERGGDPREFLEAADSASYLERTGDLLEVGHTGTNVSDLWVLWKVK